MKKTIMTILIFAAVLAALVAVAALVERARPAGEPEESASEAAEETVVTNEMNELKSTRVSLADGRASVVGVGAQLSDGVLTIGYPGTYRLEGELSDGQIVVDLGDFHGAVYLILDGVTVTSGSGPALHVKQADLTVLHLTEGAENAFTDGADYVVTEGQNENSGAGIYSADDLVIEGSGALTVTGRTADGIRSKDALTVTGGTVIVYSADDGLQASDALAIEGGSVTVGAYGDGLATTEGAVTVSGGTLSIESAGDGIAAATELAVTGGEISVTAYGGAASYETIALGGISAKGMKAQTVTLAGGTLALDTADDAVHGGSITVTGGEITIASGDDAFHADGALGFYGGTVTVTESYEALEGGSVYIADGTITAAAERNGVDAGEDGFVMAGGLAVISAPRCVGSDGRLLVESGSLYLGSDGTVCPLGSVIGGVSGGTMVVCSQAGGSALMLENGELDGSLLFVLSEAVPAGTEIVLSDEAGAAVLRLETAEDCSAILIASGALGVGLPYTLTAGDETLTAVPGEGCTVVEPEIQAAAQARNAMGGASGGMMPGPGRP